MAFDAIVVLGCRVHGPQLLSAAAARRVVRAAEAYRQGLAPRVVTSGGKRWGNTLEAQAMSARLFALGVPEANILREEWSHSTVENARYVAALSGPHAFRTVCLITCDWHMRRALAAFRRAGLEASPLPAPTPRRSVPFEATRGAIERLHGFVDRWVMPISKIVAF